MASLHDATQKSGQKSVQLEATHETLYTTNADEDLSSHVDCQPPMMSVTSIEDTSIESDEISEQSVDGDDRTVAFALFDNISRRSLILSTVVLLCQVLMAPRILHRAGVVERDVLEDFLASSVRLATLENGWGRINGSMGSSYLLNERSRPGYKLAQEGAEAKYPIVMVPGFVTTGLELWGGEECARKHFRQRLWGSLSMAQTFFGDRHCWRRHLSLDPYTGMDPNNIRLRAAQGFEAVDYFLASYWVWGKLIENLADVGYDGSTMTMMTYDWRLSFPLLEERDGYLTKLRYAIEASHHSNGKKVVLMAHSMGTSLVLYFFAWVTRDVEDGGGGGGVNWVDEHIHSFINIAGPVLGVPKAATALLSGEMRDTSALLGTIGTVAEQFFGRKLRKNMFNTWGSLWAMLPKGGDAIWGWGIDVCGEGIDCGTGDEATQDQPHKRKERQVPPVPLLSMNPVAEDSSQGCATEEESRSFDSAQECPKTVERRHQQKGEDLNTLVWSTVQRFTSSRTLSVEHTIDFLQRWGGGYGPSLSSAELHSFEKNGEITRDKWHDPTSTPLPYAPSLAIYCMYGVGLSTERAYFYRENEYDGLAFGSTESGSETSTLPQDPPLVMDTSVNDPDRHIKLGVRFSDGDASVPLVSQGYMCVDGWTRPNSGFNPSGTKVVTREYTHRHEFQVDDPMRGGPLSTDHVDILGNIDMTEDILKLVTDHDSSSVGTRLLSDIESVVEGINNGTFGGLKLAQREGPQHKRWLDEFLFSRRRSRRRRGLKSRPERPLHPASWLRSLFFFKGCGKQTKTPKH